MTEFLESEDGLLVERSVHDLAVWYHERSPGTAQLAFEAMILMLRVSQMFPAPPDRASQKRFNSVRYNVLRLLYKADGRRLLMSEIGQGLSVSPTKITKLVNDLVHEGLGERAPDPEDKRKRWAELTATGAERFEAELPLIAGLVQKLWECLNPEEKRLLVHLLSKFRLRSAERKAAQGPPEVSISRQAR